MFEAWRKSQVERLLSLTDRFKLIRNRAIDHDDTRRQFNRGMGINDPSESAFGRMAHKANNCWIACIDANEALLVRRASPVLFWWQLPSLERVASNYEATLKAADAGAAFGNAQFQNRMQIVETNDA